MRRKTFIALLPFLACQLLTAGSINVVHLGPQGVMKFEVSADGAKQDFTLAHGDDTGPFQLPDKPAGLRGFHEGIPSLDIPPSEHARIAVLSYSETAFKWHLFAAKPSPDKWTFRVINLAPLPATIESAGGKIEIPSGGESAMPVSRKSEIRLKMNGLIDASYEGSEPSAVVALLYRDEEGNWHTRFLPDR